MTATGQIPWSDDALRKSLGAQESRNTQGSLSAHESLDVQWVTKGVLLVEQRHPLLKPHGRLALSGALQHPIDELAPRCADATPSDPAGWVFLDTETSGLAGGTGTWIFTLGLARFEAEQLVLRQWLLTRLDAEAAMLEAALSGMADATLLISYNGKSFDLPLLGARLRLSGQRHGLDALPHLDLLHPVRRAFASRWPDCRLASVEQRLLGVHRANDLPGAEAPGVWRDWLQRRDGRRLGAVLHHNRLDLLSLVTLIPALREVRQAPWHFGADLGALARERLGRGDPAGALACLERAEAAFAKLERSDLTSDLTTAERLLYARLLRRLDQAERARSIWETLAEQGEPRAIEALAKFLEHQCRDFSAALDWARRLPEGPGRTRRCQRLLTRLGDQDACGSCA